jgi:hypothetical protein
MTNGFFVMAQNNSANGEPITITITGINERFSGNAEIAIYSDFNSMIEHEMGLAFGFGSVADEKLTFSLLEYDKEKLEQIDFASINGEDFLGGDLTEIKNLMNKNLPEFTASGSYIILLLFTNREESYIYTKGLLMYDILVEAGSEEKAVENFPRCLLSGDTNIAFNQFIAEIF